MSKDYQEEIKELLNEISIENIPSAKYYIKDKDYKIKDLEYRVRDLYLKLNENPNTDNLLNSEINLQESPIDILFANLYTLNDLIKEYFASREKNITYSSVENNFKEYTKDYTKYKILIRTNTNGEFKLYKQGLPKRKLLAEIVNYLISNNEVCSTNSPLDRLFTSNSFGRTFDTSNPDIIYGCEAKERSIDYKRYEKLDFSNNENAGNQGVFFVSNQWDKTSITKLIDYINNQFSYCLKIEKNM